MSSETKLSNVIAIRIDEVLSKRIEREQLRENRRVKGEMARILLVEALDVREAKLRRKRA